MATSNQSTLLIGSGGEKWIRRLIDPLVVGHSSSDQPKDIRHLNSRLRILNACKSGRVWMLDRWDADRFEDHANGSKNYFYCSSRKQRGLIGIDVDCHDSGTPADALNYCRWLSETSFPNLHFESSTSGSGAHAYIELNWGFADIDDVFAVLRRLKFWLNAQAVTEGFDIELVEIKGTPSRPTWGSHRGEMKDIRFGDLFKLPRNLDQCQHTTKLRLHELSGMIGVSGVKQLPNTVARAVRSDTVSLARKTPAKSVSGGQIARGRIEELLPVGRRIVDELKPVAKRKKPLSIKAEHVAIFLAIAEFFDQHPTKDGSNPVARMKALWQSCYADGTAKVQHHESVVAAIRNSLCDAGLIVVVDSRYCTATPRLMRQDQPKLQGRAMRWRLDLAALEAVVSGQNLAVLTRIYIRENGHDIVSGQGTRPMRVSEAEYHSATMQERSLQA